MDNLNSTLRQTTLSDEEIVKVMSLVREYNNDNIRQTINRIADDANTNYVENKILIGLGQLKDILEEHFL